MKTLFILLFIIFFSSYAGAQTNTSLEAQRQQLERTREIQQNAQINNREQQINSLEQNRQNQAENQDRQRDTQILTRQQQIDSAEQNRQNLEPNRQNRIAATQNSIVQGNQAIENNRSVTENNRQNQTDSIQNSREQFNRSLENNRTVIVPVPQPTESGGSSTPGNIFGPVRYEVRSVPSPKALQPIKPPHIDIQAIRRQNEIMIGKAREKLREMELNLRKNNFQNTQNLISEVRTQLDDKKRKMRESARNSAANSLKGTKSVSTSKGTR